MTASAPDVFSDLASPAAYDHPVDTVSVVQTHISYVLLAGAYAYKIKKPRDFGFLDYTTLERRRHMCEDEVRLNRRLCDGVYLGVVPIVRGADGRHRMAGAGEPVEFAVQMRRVSEEQMMPSLLATGSLGRQHLSSLAAKIAAFHRAADSGERIADFGRLPAVRANWEENFAQAQVYVGRTLTPEQFASVRGYVGRLLADHGDLIEERAGQRRVRDGHGDLRADSVVFAPDGSVCVMDCIEFNERLRYGDVASDVAFLAMDLEFRGCRLEADEFTSLYLESWGGDETLTAVHNFYRAYRAFVRGKVDSMLTDEDEVPITQRAQAAERASRYFALAAACAESTSPQQLVMMSGLSGTGKSFIARAVAARLGTVLLSTDLIRRETLAAAVPGPYGEKGYTAGERQQVYEEMFRRARYHVGRGRSVLLDGTFLTREQREGARTVALSAGLSLLVVQTVADEDVVRERLRARGEGDVASDARWDTYLAQRARLDPLDDVPPAQLVKLDSTQPLHRLVDQVCERSRNQRG
jgi:aminoglycoside phosphotransferase family enzyme/predicted kinase